MGSDPLETEAHELLGQLAPGQLAAVVHLLKVMISDEEPVTAEDRLRFQGGEEWFERHGGKGIPMEDVLADFGLKSDDFPLK